MESEKGKRKATQKPFTEVLHFGIKNSDCYLKVSSVYPSKIMYNNICQN